jgi:cell division protein FtsL
MAPTAAAQARKTTVAKRESAARHGRKIRYRQVFLMLGLTAALIVLVLVHVWLRLQVVHTGYVLSTTSKLQSRLEQENRELKIELATLTSPERLDSLARQRLGLRAPEKGQVIVLP